MTRSGSPPVKRAPPKRVQKKKRGRQKTKNKTQAGRSHFPVRAKTHSLVRGADHSVGHGVAGPTTLECFRLVHGASSFFSARLFRNGAVVNAEQGSLGNTWSTASQHKLFNIGTLSVVEKASTEKRSRLCATPKRITAFHAVPAVCNIATRKPARSAVPLD